MPDYAALQATATRLIASSGAERQLRRQVGGVFDPVEGINSGAGYESQPVSLVLLPPSGDAEQYEGENLNLSKVVDVIISASALSFSIEALHEIDIGGLWWKLRGITPISPDGATTVLYMGWAVLP